MEPVVDIAFDCLPLRSVGQMDVPLDASPAFAARCQRLQQAFETHGPDNAYFLYNAHCAFRLANSDVQGLLRFAFEGTVGTDRSDAKAAWADLHVELTADTCGGLPPQVAAWFGTRVEQAVLVEFDRFIVAGRLADRLQQLGQVERLSDVADFAGMHL